MDTLYKLWSVVLTTFTQPSSAKSLVEACETHVQEKQKELVHLKEKATAQALVVECSRENCKQAHSIVTDAETTKHEKLAGLRERLKTLRGAINLSMEHDPTEVNALYQTCIMCSEFDATGFLKDMKEADSIIQSYKEAYSTHLKEKESHKKDLQHTNNNIVTVKQHVVEIETIREQLSQKIYEGGKDKQA